MKNQDKKSTLKTPAISEQPIKKPKSKWLIPVIVVVGIIVLGLIVWGAYELIKSRPIACTEEAKECPNGSFVARNPELDCEFNSCPKIEDETTNWKIYRNKEYGFEFKYDPDLQGGDELTIDNKVAFGYSSSINLMLDIVPIEASFKELHSGYTQFSPSVTPTITNEIIGGKMSKLYKFPEDTFVYIPLNEVSKLEIFGETGEFFDSVFNQIISTFKFIKPIDASDWEIYKNEEYRYEIKYPSNWIHEAKEPDEFYGEEALFVVVFNPIEEVPGITGGTRIELIIYNNPYKLSLMEFQKEQVWDDIEIIKSEKLNNLNVTYFDFGGKPPTTISATWKQDERIFSLEDVYGDYQDQIFSTILSTFKFLD